MTGNQLFFLYSTVTLQSGATLTVNAPDQLQILDLGAITAASPGTPAVIKTAVGPARFNLQGSTYSGDTLIQNGTMSINVATATSPNSRLVARIRAPASTSSTWP